MRATRILTALPVYNEVTHLNQVLDEVVQHADEVLVIDDGSTDGSAELLAKRSDIQVVTHAPNRGYGAALRSAFCYARRHKYDIVVTIDCDGQHEPCRIQKLAAELTPGIDIVSGSRYLDDSPAAGVLAPADRRRINRTITAELNERFALGLTDAFCGFKAYRVSSLTKLRLTEEGYAMPLQLWVQAAHRDLRVIEAPVPRIYLDEQRTFGGDLDDAERRLAYYRSVINQAVELLVDDSVESPDPCAEIAALAAATAVA